VGVFFRLLINLSRAATTDPGGPLPLCHSRTYPYYYHGILPKHTEVTVSIPSRSERENA
jgi:hypothetical protein